MDKKLKIFTKKDCPKCPMAKVLGMKLEGEFPIEYVDCSTPRGLAEARGYGLLATPSLVLVDPAGKELASWRSEVPSVETVRDAFLK